MFNQIVLKHFSSTQLIAFITDNRVFAIPSCYQIERRNWLGLSTFMWL